MAAVAGAFPPVFRKGRLGRFAALAATAAAMAGCVAPPAASEATSPATLANRLPPVAAGFVRGESRPAASVAGQEVAYSTERGRATAAANVELLADASEPAPALDQALAEAVRAGPAREVREAGRFAVAPAGGAPLLCAETTGRYGRERVSGLLCTGRSGGALVRIRVAMPVRLAPPADPRAFAAAIAVALRG